MKCLHLSFYFVIPPLSLSATWWACQHTMESTLSFLQDHNATLLVTVGTYRRSYASVFAALALRSQEIG